MLLALHEFHPVPVIKRLHLHSDDQKRSCIINEETYSTRNVLRFKPDRSNIHIHINTKQQTGR